MIKSAPLSFVRFEHPDENDFSMDLPFTLPAVANHDIAFQFLVTNDRTYADNIVLGVGDEAGTLLFQFAGPVGATIVKYKYKITGLNTNPTFLLNSITIGLQTETYNTVITPAELLDLLHDDFGVETLDDYILLKENVSITFDAPGSGFHGDLIPLWHQGHVSISGITLDSVSTPEIFTYMLLGEFGSVLGYSNPFIIYDDEEYTSLVSYRCNESGFGFEFSEDAETLKVRLPMYLLRPQNPSKRSAYRKSNGLNSVLSAVLDKEYEITTEQMPEVFHDCLSALLLHDYIRIQCLNIRETDVEVIHADGYTVAWENEEERWPLGKGKSKVKIAQYGYQNSNC